jgi:hypothetical protein
VTARQDRARMVSLAAVGGSGERVAPLRALTAAGGLLYFDPDANPH